MRDLSAQTGIGTDADFLNGNLVDDQTEINEGINQDLVQFFQKLAALAALAPNGLPDNETNGYQLITALETVARSFVATTLLKGTVEKATTAEAQNGTADKFLDAALLQTVTATTDRLGIVEKATPAEVLAGTADKFVDAALLQGIAQFNVTYVSIPIGAWNMQGTSAINVAYTPPTGKKIVSIKANIYEDGYPSPDGASLFWNLEYSDGIITDLKPQGTIQGYGTSTAGNIRLIRTSGGTFDSAGFNDGAQNRGNLIIGLISV